MASMTVTARVAGTPSSFAGSSLRLRRQWRVGATVAALAVFASGSAFSQTLPPAAGGPPVEPLPGTMAPPPPPPPAPASPSESPPGAFSTAPDPYAVTAPNEQLLTPPPPVDEPIYDRWWFWTAVGAVVVVGLVVAVSASGSKTPNTYYGNGRAF